MIDFELTVENLVKQDSAKLPVKGTEMKIEYRVHKDEFVNPKDPEGKPLERWCVHLPQIEQAYVDESEELVLEAFEEFFEEDFIRFFAQRLVDEREKDIVDGK